jgi:hypothetical protein
MVEQEVDEQKEEEEAEKIEDQIIGMTETGDLKKVQRTE